MREWADSIQDQFPTVWLVEFLPSGEHGCLRVRVHASPLEPICHVLLSRLVASFVPDGHYQLDVHYKATMTRFAGLVEEAFQELLR